MKTTKNENINRPVTNLIHNFLELAFYATTNNCVITIIFDDNHDLNHIAYGYHNLNYMTIQFYDVYDTLYTENLIIEDNESIYYFNKIEAVKKMVITCTTLALLLYIGSIFTGEYLDLPLFSQAPQFERVINDSNFRSSGGQSSGVRKRNYNRYPLLFENISIDELDDMRTYLNCVQGSKPHFIDRYPDAHNQEPVFYGVVESQNIPTPKRRIANFKYDASISYRESR